jgi:hypothetical protein
VPVTRTAENFVNYQQRATEFAVGDLVVPYGHPDDLAGRVTAVWPGIGMVDVEFPAGNKRYPVEDLQRLNVFGNAIPPFGESIPGGAPTVSVPGGPYPQRNPEALDAAEVLAAPSLQRVAQAFVKKAIYWASADRHYRATTEELSSDHFKCPKCRARGQDSTLRPAVYKRREGKSEKLLGCQMCLFLIKREDILPECTEALDGEGTI